jgi:hypothetical protein
MGVPLRSVPSAKADDVMIKDKRIKGMNRMLFISFFLF